MYALKKNKTHHYDNQVIYWVFVSENFYIEDIFKPFPPPHRFSEEACTIFSSWGEKKKANSKETPLLLMEN